MALAYSWSSGFSSWFPGRSLTARDFARRMGGASVLVCYPGPLPRVTDLCGYPHVHPTLTLQIPGVDTDIPNERSAVSSTRQRAVLRRERGGTMGGGLGIGEEGRQARSRSWPR
jgi:hypothetical protein